MRGPLVGWWARRGTAGVRVDESLPPLSVDEAALLRRSVHRWLAAHGQEAVVGGQAARADGTWGLANLARICAEHPAPVWPRLIDAHLSTLVRASGKPLDLHELPPEAVLGQAMVRLWPVDTTGIDSVAGYRKVVEGLAQTLVVDAPTHVRTISRSNARRFGEAALAEAAYLNLAAGRYEHRAVEVEGYCFDVVYSDSTYAASKLIVMPALLAELYGDDDVGRGVLVGVADRSMLVAHRLGDGSGEAATELLAAFVAARHAQAPWPLSPHVYRWHDGRLGVEEPGSDSPTVSPAVTVLGAALARSGLIAASGTGTQAAVESDGLGIDLTPIPPKARETMAIALRVCRDHICHGVLQAGSVTPFVLMGSRDTFDLVLLDAEALAGFQDPFTFMHQFRGGKNRFAIMGMDAVEDTGTAAVPSKCAVLQIEHEAGYAQRLIVSYRQPVPGQVRFRGPYEQQTPRD